MSLSHLSAGAFAAGLLLLATLLFLLARLRVRHREVPVVTTMFWREAVEDARARVLVRRFRHPWAYLLALVVATLLFAVVAGARLDEGDGRRTVLLLDGSAETGPGRFEEAVRALIEDRAARPDGRTSVVLCGAIEQTLLAEGEAAALLPRRLAGLGPEATPPSVERMLRTLAAAADAADTSVVVFGAAPVREETLALLPPGMEVTRASLASVPPGAAADEGTPPSRPPRVVAFGASEAASGDWTAVDLLVTIEGDAAAADRLVVRGAAPREDASRSVGADGRSRVVLRDVPARGQVVEATLAPRESPEGEPAPEDALGGRQLVLPGRAPVTVALDAGLEETLGALLDADAGLERAPPDAPEEAEVVILGSGTDPSSVAGRAALAFVADEDAIDTFVVRDPSAEGDEAEERAVERLLLDLGLAELEADGLATRTGKEIGLTRTAPDEGAVRRVEVRASLLAPEAGFTNSRSFATFVAQTVRWLADRPPLRPEVVASEPLEHVVALADPAGRTVDAAGQDVVPLRAGVHRTARGDRVAVALPPGPSAAARDPLRPATPARAAGASDALSTAFLLLAFAALVFEWWLHRTGRIP